MSKEFRKRVPGSEPVPQPTLIPDLPASITSTFNQEGPNKRSTSAIVSSNYINPEYGRVVQNHADTATITNT